MEDFKAIIEKVSINQIIEHAKISYPNECCGLVLSSGLVFSSVNIVDSLNNKTLTTKNAFLIDGNTWKLASQQQSPIAAIYHSHTNGDVNMSSSDLAYLQWKNLYYIIVALEDYTPVSAKIYWWNNKEINSAYLAING